MDIQTGLCWRLRELLQAELSCWSRDTKGLLSESQVTYTHGLCLHQVQEKGWQVAAATSALILVTKPQPSPVKTSTVTACSVESSNGLPSLLLCWPGGFGDLKAQKHPSKFCIASTEEWSSTGTVQPPCCHPIVTPQGPTQAHLPSLPHLSQ